MASLIVIMIGFAIILGRNDLAERGAKSLVGLVLVLSFLPGALDAADGATRGCAAGNAPHVPLGWLPEALALVGLAGVGVLAWRMRDAFARRREAAARGSSAPRDRALPPAPPPDEEGPR